MKFLKNNLKVIIGFIVGMILASGITVYAYSYFAKDIEYTKIENETETIISVEDALNDLYNSINEELNIDNALFNESYGNQSSSRTASVNIENGTYIVVANVSLAFAKGRI